MENIGFDIRQMTNSNAARHFYLWKNIILHHKDEK